MEPGVNGKAFKAWPVKDQAKKDIEKRTVVLRLMYPQSVIDRPGQTMEQMFRKTLVFSGLSKGNPNPVLEGVDNETLYKEAEPFFMDDYWKNVLNFKATPDVVRAIMTDRNTDKQPFGCNPGTLSAGCYVQRVFLERQPLQADSELNFAHNLLPPRPKKQVNRQGRPADRR